MASTDVYLQPDAPDPVLSEQVVLGAARQHAPYVSSLLQVDESGGEARAYILDADVVMKTQRPHRLRPRTSLSKEAAFLRVLEREGDLPVPRVLGYGHVEGIEYLCITRVPGTAMRHVDLSQDQREAVLNDLGYTLRRVHQIDQAPLVSSGLLPGDTTGADLRTRFADTFDQLAEDLAGVAASGTADAPASADADNRIMLDVATVAAERLSVTPTDVDPVALHSNPGPQHVFVDPDTGRFTGLIDFGDAYRSHPALDLRVWPNPADAQSLLAGYASLGALSESFEEVRRTGLVILALTRAARGAPTTRGTSQVLDEFLRP